MFKNRRPNARSPYSKSIGRSSTALRGSFEHGQWHCDCNPRLPAERFQVKKEGKNKGRWFYTCQKHEAERCGFFLWEDDARPRMEAAVFYNSNAEPASAVNKEEGDRLEGKKGKKRSLPWQQDSNVTEDTSFDVTDEEEVALSQAANQSKPRTSLETPRKAQKTTPFETPSSKTSKPHPQSTLRNGLPTPGTTPHQSKVLYPQQQPEPETPTPVRSKDVLTSAPIEDTMSDKVFKLLALFDIKIDNHTSNALRGLLESESRRHQGVVKGRDAARSAIQTRDERIAELLERCTQLEGENEANKALLRYLRTK